MWEALLAAIGLLLVLEGISPFLSPRGFRATLMQVARFDDRTLRTLGLVMMVAGALLIYWLRPGS